ncbi:MAG: hypothetical protein ABJC09_17155 [Terriglobia bacterium]
MQTRARPPAWLWFGLLSLDAPLIALVWQDFLARCYPTVLPATGRCTLGLTVWAIYLADRLLDVRQPASAAESIRHQFCRRHRAFVRSLLFVVAVIDVLVTRLWLRPAVFDNGLFVTAGVAVYLGAFPFTGWGAASWKRPLAAVLFTAGTFLIAWTGASHPVRQLGWPAAAFCALCVGNLKMIGRWSHQTIPRRLNISRRWIWVLFLAACVAGVQGCTWFTAIIFSAAGLLALARWGRKISRDARCVLADALLLTPLLFR